MKIPVTASKAVIYWSKEWLLLIVQFSMVIFITSMNGIPTEEPQQMKKDERKLSRKRRYLIFPTGSSIQLVYDATYTIPDYTLYVTTGITCALAWGLPDKPTYPELELMERYENGSLPLIQYRKDKNVTDSNRLGEIPTNTKPNINSSTDLNYGDSGNDVANRIANYYKYFQQRKPDSFYFGNSPLNPMTNYNRKVYCNNRNCAYHANISYHLNDNDNRRKSNVHNLYNVRPPYSVAFDTSNRYDAFAKYMSNTYFKPWIETPFNQAKSTTVPTKPATQATETSKPPDFKPIINKLHTVYPAMGKRSIRDTSLTYEQKFYLDHHRNTRHKLYEIIEKYLFAKGLNGTECVLKTLCEVGQKQHETEPGSFLAEIIRVVFSLPVAQLQHAVHRRHIAYDDAHQNAIDCDAKFPLCPDSIWKAGFLIESDATFVNQNNAEQFLIKNK